MHTLPTQSLTLACSLNILAFSLQADDVKQWGVGITASNHLHQYKNLEDDGDINLLAGIYLEYRGQQLSIARDSFSWQLNQAGALRYELLGKVKNRGYQTDKLALFSGMGNRKKTLDLGARVSFSTNFGVFSPDIS